MIQSAARKIFEVDGYKVQIDILDTAGQEEYVRNLASADQTEELALTAGCSYWGVLLCE